MSDAGSTREFLQFEDARHGRMVVFHTAILPVATGFVYLGANVAPMFTQTTAFYDKIAAARGKNYRAEAEAIARFVRRDDSGATTLLDVGCGTGGHLAEFGRLGFACRGIDADFKMVALARSRLPDIRVDPADMTTLALGERFDVVVALFGTVAYTRTANHLDDAIARMAEHVRPGGVLIVEPFLSSSEYRPGHVDGVFVDEPDLKIARMSLSKRMGRIGILDFHYLVASLTGVERYFERHELGLFDEATYRDAFSKAGLDFVVSDVAPRSFDRAPYAGRARHASAP